MKVAATLSGQPRFMRDFDVQLHNIQGYDQIDWFLYLWNDFQNQKYVSPFFNNPENWNEKTIREKIEQNLPANHRIACLKIVDVPIYNDKITEPFVSALPWGIVKNIWYMTLGWKLVNELREQYEQENGIYDLVIRTRPELLIDPQISLKNINECIKNNPTSILTSSIRRYGLQGRAVSDIMGISNSKTMSIFCNLFDKLEEYNNSMVPYHGETLVAHHLTLNNIETPITDFIADCKILYHQDGTRDWGKWN